MTIYVDPLTDWGMKYRGKPVKTCHMVSDGDLAELHQTAVKLGLRRYFQDDPRHPHYDLMASRREIAVKTLGAKEVSTKELLEIVHGVDWSEVAMSDGAVGGSADLTSHSEIQETAEN